MSITGDDLRPRAAAAATATRSEAIRPGTVHLVVPAGTTDVTRPTGGNVYDLRLAEALTRQRWRVVTREVEGSWPRPDAADAEGLAATLAQVPNGATTIVDGIVALGSAATLAREARRLRVVVLVHMPHVAGSSAGARAAEGEVLAAAAVVVTTSDWSRRQLLASYPLDPRRVHVCAPGVTPSPCHRPSATGGRLLCLGTVSSVKGQDLLLAALDRLADVPGWILRLVGRLDIEPAFVTEQQALIRSSALRGRVLLQGPRWGPALEDVWCGTDLLVLPSRAESFGMVVLEALAHGVPVVASHLEGVPESMGCLADGERPGILVSPGDVAGLAGALRRWLTDPTTRAVLRQRAAHRRATLPGWADTAHAVAAVLEVSR